MNSSNSSISSINSLNEESEDHYDNNKSLYSVHDLERKIHIKNLNNDIIVEYDDDENT